MRFTLVTTHHLCNNPRLVKEADALTLAGHDVRVVWLDARADLRARDDALAASRRWTLVPVGRLRRGASGWISWAWDGARRKVARRLSDVLPRSRFLAEEALTRSPRALARAVRAGPADVIVAHTLGALPPAARAARTLGARLVFDAEDLHVGELADTAANAGERRRITTVEKDYLPRCDRLIASSDGIADALSRMYGVPRPTVVLNAFPLPGRDAAARTRPAGARLRLYWYSQVIGADRGIQTALDAMAALDGSAELYLRGEERPELTRELRERAAAAGVADHVHLLPTAPPDELPLLATQYDVGLALETGESENRALCVTNKLLTYLAAGLAVAASDTPGQRGILDQAPGAGFLFPVSDAQALAAGLRQLSADPQRLAASKRAARQAANEHFSWELEQHRLLDVLARW